MRGFWYLYGLASVCEFGFGVETRMDIHSSQLYDLVSLYRSEI